MKKLYLSSSGWRRTIVIIFVQIIFSIVVYLFFSLIFGKSDLLIENSEELNPRNAFFTQLFQFVIDLSVIAFFMHLVDRKPFISLGLFIKNRKLDIILGTLFGFIFFLLALILLKVLKMIEIIEFEFDFKNLIWTIGLFILVAFGEELFFRGYILRNLMNSFNKHLALLISSLLFSLIHGLNPNINLIGFIGLFFAGVLLGSSYIYTKNLWFPIALHFSWNLFQSLFGFNVSGQDTYSLLNLNILDSGIITGGAFGFEGSIFSIIIEVILIICIVFYYEKKQSKKLHSKNSFPAIKLQ